MSYCRMNVITKSGNVTHRKTFHNSHGGVMYIWDELCRKYLSIAHFSRLENSSSLWKLYEDNRLTKCEKVALLSTYDYAVVKKENLQELALSYRKFLEIYPNTKQYICHLNAWADELESIIKENKDIIGVCFYPISVGEDIWDEYYFHAREDHFSVFDYL